MEIERKWLIDSSNIPYDLSKLERCSIEQAYVSFSPVIRIRKINDGKRYLLTVKGDVPGSGHLVRREYELEISSAQYASLMKKAEGNVINKTRYFHKRSDGLVEEIDLFEGSLDGLAYLEIEFEDEESARAFPSPEWTIADVTEVKGFNNGALARFGMPRLTV